MNLGFREKPKLTRIKSSQKISFWTILILDNSLIKVNIFSLFPNKRKEEKSCFIPK